MHFTRIYDQGGPVVLRRLWRCQQVQSRLLSFSHSFPAISVLETWVRLLECLKRVNWAERHERDLVVLKVAGLRNHDEVRNSHSDFRLNPLHPEVLAKCGDVASKEQITLS